MKIHFAFLAIFAFFAFAFVSCGPVSAPPPAVEIFGSGYFQTEIHIPASIESGEVLVSFDPDNLGAQRFRLRLFGDSFYQPLVSVYCTKSCRQTIPIELLAGSYLLDVESDGDWSIIVNR